MGWHIALGIIILLGILPLGVSTKYDDAGALIRVIAGPVRITLFPRKKKDKPKKASKTAEKENSESAVQAEMPMKLPEEATKPEKKTKKEKEGGSLLDFLPLVKLAFQFLGDFRRKLRVKRLEMKLILAGDDPCDLALNYGRAWAALGNLMPKLEKWFVIKKRDLDVECDFTADETKIYVRLDITITLGRLLGLGVGYGVRAIVQFLKIRKQSKGGAVNEPKSS